MPPWTDRLMTKIRKFYVVRLLMPNGNVASGESAASGVGGGFYRTSRVGRTSVYRQRTSAAVQRHRQHRRRQVQSSDGGESFTNSQSVPESAARAGDAPNCGAAVLSVPSSQESDESYYSVRNSSANEASCSSSSAVTVVNGRRRRRTPRYRISDSSRAYVDAAKPKLEQKKLNLPHGFPAAAAAASKLGAPVKSSLPVERRHRRQLADEADEPEVSVPASCTMPNGWHCTRSQLLISKPGSLLVAAASSNTREAIMEKKELVFAVVVDDDEAGHSTGAEDAAAAATAAAAVEKPSEAKATANDDRPVQPATRYCAFASSPSSAHNSGGHQVSLCGDTSTASTVPPETATKIVEFSVARPTGIAAAPRTVSPTSTESQRHHSWRQRQKQHGDVENGRGPKSESRVLVAKRVLKLEGPGESCIQQVSGRSCGSSSGSSSSSSSTSSSSSCNSFRTATTGFTCAVSTKIAEPNRRRQKQQRRSRTGSRRHRHRAKWCQLDDAADLSAAYSRTVEWSEKLGH